MSTASIAPALAQSRHPQETAGLMKALGIASPDQAKWSYSMAVRIDGSHGVNANKGIQVFLRHPDRHHITLEAVAGRKRRQVELDRDTLLAGPKENLPVELFEHTPRLAGVSAYFWQPTRTESPGWNECILTRGARMGNAVLLEGKCDDGATRLIRVEGKFWQEVQHAQATLVFGKALAKATQSWLAQGKPFPPNTATVMSQEEIEQVISPLPDRKLPAFPSTASDLLAELGMGHQADTIDQDPPVAPPMTHGRMFAWGQQVEDDVIAPYANLMAAQSGVSSGNFMAVLAGLSDPVNHAIKQVAATMLDRLASGDDPAHACNAALSGFAHQHGLPVPAPAADPASFLRQHLTGAEPVAINPIALSPRRG